MADDFKDPVKPEFVEPDSGKSLSWNQVWIQATTRPSLETYQRLLADPGASANKAYLWIFASSVVGYILYFLLTLVFPNPLAFGDYADVSFTGLFGSAIIYMICCLPFAAAIAVIGVMISSALTQLVARLLGGEGTYVQLVYLFGAIIAPLSLVTYLLSAIPFVNCFSVLLSIYSVALLVMAVNAVNRFGYGKAIVAYFLIPVIVAIIGVCLMVLMFAAIAPEIESVLQEMINALETPVPQL